MSDERRAAALATMWERFPAVEERFRRVYGLRMPRHVAVFAAFWSSLDDEEWQGVEDLGLRLCGVTEYFTADGLRRVSRDGLDERLHHRFRRDPAEFVTVMGGDTDGLHFGLWYDDPAELPSFVVHNYARDSAETWTHHCPTILAEVRDRLERVADDAEDEDEEEREALLGRLELIEGALDWFADADAQALADDGPRRYADVPRPASGVSIGAVLPPGSGDPRLAEEPQRDAAFRKDPAAAARWIADAAAELAAGRPALALTVGAELHWLDSDAYRQHGVELLAGAYRALGRDALAEIAEVHHANRDLRSVDVFNG